jgi:ABC-type Fe3+/spermidine/putrescine transport system ATPase subunit
MPGSDEHMTTSAALVIDDLTIRYHEQGAAVSGVSLACEPGELVVLLGPSGSGKSSTLRCVAGLVAPAQGEIMLDGASITRLAPEHRGVGLVLQHPTLFPHLSVVENVAFGLHMRGVGRAERRRRALAMLNAVQLDGYAERRPHQLSGGQGQRVAVARALVIEPRVLLLDEPFSALDPALRDDMRALVRRLQRERGVTTLLVTHDQAEAAILADRIALLLDGRVQQVATPATMYRRPANRAVARFFGAQNLLDGVLHGDGHVTSALGVLVLAQRPLPPGPVTLMIRSEHVRLHAHCEHGIAAQVRDCQFLGSGYRYTLVVGSAVLVATTVEAALHPGDDVWIEVPPEHVWLLRD